MPSYKQKNPEGIECNTAKHTRARARARAHTTQHTPYGQNKNLGGKPMASIPSGS